MIVVGHPLVSIGLPVYNGGLQLAGTIESICSQPFTDIEVVICDNCSTDQTSEICRSAAERDPRIRYFRNESNIGVSKNFVRVLELAQAPLFLWAAHDDLREPEYVRVLAAVLQETPGAVLATGRCRFVDSSGLQKPEWGIAPFASGSPIAVAQELFKGHSTHWIYGLFRTRWLLNNVWKFSAIDPWGGDLLFLLDMALDGVVTGSSDAIIVKQVKYGSSMRPQTPRQTVAWNVRYVRALVKLIEARRLTRGQRLVLYRAASNHYRTHIVPYDTRGLFTLLARALYHTLTNADRP